MRILLILSLLFLTACNNHKEDNNFRAETNELTTYYFIRHAEKDTLDKENKDPELTHKGIARAENWAKIFKDVDFDLIYSSDYKRTRNTAKPIAEDKGKEILFYNTQKLNEEEFQEKTRGKKVLVVGHSNLNPEFVNYILQEEKYEELDESVYGSLFIVHLLPDGSRTSEVLYID